MRRFYPMATYDGQTDNFHTLTTYDSLDSIDDCLEVIRSWISIGYKIDRCWIQIYRYENDSDPEEYEVKL